MTSIPISYSEFMQLSSRERVRHEKAMQNLESRLHRYQEICRHDKTKPVVGTGLLVCIACNKEV